MHSMNYQWYVLLYSCLLQLSKESEEKVQKAQDLVDTIVKEKKGEV